MPSAILPTREFLVEGHSIRTPSTLVRWGAVGFVLAGVLWVMPAVLGLIGGVQFTLRFVGLLLLALGLVGLHALLGERYGDLGRAGCYTAFIATIVQALSALGTVVLQPFAAPSFGPLLALVALLGLLAGLGWLVGFVLLGVATLRARVLPSWYGVLLIILALVLVAAQAHGGFSDYEWPGLVLVVLGYGLWLRRDALGEPSSVR